MKILALEKDVPGTTDDQFKPYLKAEAARAWELYQSGIIREFYFRADREEAVLVLECSNVDEAKSAVDSLPLVRAGLIAFEIIPLKAYPGFARLFTSQSLVNRPSDAIHPKLPFSQETRT